MPNTLTRDRRIEARADSDTADLINQAAKLNNETVSSFVVGAAREKAERLIARADRTFMPAVLFDEIMASLNGNPKPAPELVELFGLPGQFTRR